MSTVIAENFKAPDGTTVVPVGTVIMYYGLTAPTGYLECDGQSTTGYDELETLIGSNTPDLRGEFIRGWDNGRGVDTGRALGSTQDDQFQTHTHTMRVLRESSGINKDTVGGPGSFGDVSTNGITGRNGTETRPRNIALMYCIKH